MKKTHSAMLVVTCLLGALAVFSQRVDVADKQSTRTSIDPDFSSAELAGDERESTQEMAEELPLGENDGDVMPRPYTPKPFGETVVFTAGEVCDELGNNCRIEPITDHPYASLTDEELEGIAEYDGAAAIILALRISRTSFDDAKPWAARGFLLTGDPYAYHMIMTFNDVRSGFTLVDGKIDSERAKNAYVWLETGHRLGVVDASRSQYQASVLQEYGVEGINELDVIAQRRERLYRSKRVEMTGSDFQ